MSETVAFQDASISARTAARPGARLTRGDDVADAQPGRVDPLLARARGEMGRERQGAEDRGDAELRDQVEQATGLPGADGDDGRAAGLQRHVVGDPAGVERVVEAVRDDVVGPQARDGERLAADGAVGLVVAACEPDGTGSPVVPDVTWMRTSAAGGAQTCTPSGGSRRWPSRSSSLVVNGSRGRSPTARMSLPRSRSA